MNSLWLSFKEGFFGPFKLVAAIALAVYDVTSAFVNGRLDEQMARRGKSSQV